MRLNILKLSKDSSLRTHEGAPACTMTPEQALRRTALSCLLWEKEFYEGGVQIATRIRDLVPQVAAKRVAALAVEAGEQMKLRHMPLLLVREMARHATHRALVADTLAQVIQRADELSEFVAICWAGGKQPLSAQVKKGLAGAFCKFDEYALGKYDRAGAVRLRDVLFLSHARPVDAAQADLWKRLLAERKLGALALLRNLRNMHTAGVREELVLEALANLKADRVLPFRFLAAVRSAPQWEQALEAAMFRSLEGHASKLHGHTVLLVDVSGSMNCPLSQRSEMHRTDAAYGLAILLREIAEKVSASLYGQESPSQQKPVVPDTPYSFMGLVPGESKADAVIVLTNIWNAQENAAFGKFVTSHHKDAWPPPLPFTCTAYTVSGKPVGGTELCHSEITLTVRELYYETPNPIQIFYLTFVDGYLEAVEYDFLRTSFVEMVQALGNKYGPAMTVNHVTLQNGFGAQFDRSEYTWDNGISSITARQYHCCPAIS
jgi:hypothetical protein